MNREIKFRVWDKDKERFLTPIECSQLVIRPFSGRVTDGATIPNVELMQYTGLKDKNGIEIYEGDILNVSNENSKWDWKEVVIFHNGCFMNGDDDLLINLNFRSKVIGNIYENPELFEEVEK